jgi:hypothetical protein
MHPHRSPYCAVAASAGKPHLLKLVEVAHFRAKDVDDDVARVDQNPVAGILAFELAGHAVALLEPVHQFLGDRRDLPGERPEATIIQSAMADFPRRSICTISSALSSSREAMTRSATHRW